jgi:hypothetical protein
MASHLQSLSRYFWRKTLPSHPFPHFQHHFDFRSVLLHFMNQFTNKNSYLIYFLNKMTEPQACSNFVLSLVNEPVCKNCKLQKRLHVSVRIHLSFIIKVSACGNILETYSSPTKGSFKTCCAGKKRSSKGSNSSGLAKGCQ